MQTRVVTTNPAGHTVSLFKGQNLTAYQIADIYLDFYKDVFVFCENTSIPIGWYIKCFSKDNTKPVELYQIKWSDD